MKVTYDVVHVLPDKTRKIIKSVDHPNELPLLVDSPMYTGTWLTDTRKLLRYGRGEIHIQKIIHPPTAEDMQVTTVDDKVCCRLKIVNSKDVSWIELYEDEIKGYSLKGLHMFTVYSFALLAIEIDSKELAHECLDYYERFISEFNLEGAM